MTGRDEVDDDGDGDDGEGAGAALRIDRWLWYVRFYKTRSLAAQAIANGRVRIDGSRVKAARPVKVGDVLVVQVNGRDVELSVLAIPVRRGPAPEARAAYRESEASVARGLAWSAQQRLAALSVPHSDGKPDKKERRELRNLARRQGRD